VSSCRCARLLAALARPEAGRGLAADILDLHPLHWADRVPAAADAGPKGTFQKLLAIFDIVESHEERFGSLAIKAATAAERLLAKGFDLADIVAATRRMRDALQLSSPLSQFHVGSDEAGHLVLRLADRMAELDGQLRLKIDGAAADVDALVLAANHARDAGDTDQAMVLLRRALAGAPKDPELLFELGSLLCERGAVAEGLVLLQKAAALKPDLADAWYNIGCALERQNRPDEAIRAYQRAIAADPAYADPLYNLGMLALDSQAYDDAVRWLERYLALDQLGEWAAKARKGLLLARLSRSQGAKAG
jgi:tetratricopeptide (TPR) repeat protein